VAAEGRDRGHQGRRVELLRRLGGAGEVTVTARESGGAVAIDVVDRGSQTVVWPAADVTPQPLGLAMARSLAESQGGRLLLTSDGSGTCFTLLVPADEAATAGVTID
jgi:signal transduction histidine kinase